MSDQREIEPESVIKITFEHNRLMIVKIPI